MEFILGSLCNRRICSQRHRRKSSTTKRPCTKGSVAIVFILQASLSLNFSFNWLNINLNSQRCILVQERAKKKKSQIFWPHYRVGLWCQKASSKQWQPGYICNNWIIWRWKLSSKWRLWYWGKSTTKYILLKNYCLYDRIVNIYKKIKIIIYVMIRFFWLVWILKSEIGDLTLFLNAN